MPLLVRFKPGSDVAARLIGLPMLMATGGGVLVPEPAGWTERELTSFIIRRAGPYLASIGNVPTKLPALGACHCMGRRQ